MRRELRVALSAPIAYVVGGLFLVVQGLAFAALVGALSDPRRPAPLGALLEGQLAGTLLTWVLQLVVLTLLGMRTIADERRSGGWELLLTAQVSERAAVVGKWLAAVIVYALLWLPTLSYLAVVAVFRSDPGGWDLATIACGYLGAIAFGAALLAWAIAASAATTSTLAAGALGFAALIGIFLIGELPGVWPALAVDHPTLASALGAVSVRGQLAALARGELAWPSLVLIAGLAITGLSLAVALACAGRRRRREVRARFAASALVGVIGVLAGVVAARHPTGWDVSAARRNSLDAETRAVLGELPGRARVTIVEPTYGALEPVYDEVARVAARLADAGPVDVVRVDPAALPGGLPAAAREAGLADELVAKSGAVVVELAGRKRVVDVFQLATIEPGASGTPAVEAISIEQALAGALAELSSPVPIAACATTGHGELSLVQKSDSGDWTAVADRLRAEGTTIDEITSDVPARCSVVIVAGPKVPLSADDALGLQAFVARGGGLLVAASARRVPDGTLPATGLEALLGQNGLGLPQALAADPALARSELPGALFVATGYAPHPINDGFERTRTTVWYPPRAVLVTKGAKPLVSATAASWGERDLDNPVATKDADDLAGPVALAALGEHKVVVVGSAESFERQLVGAGASAADLWAAHAVRWLAGAKPPRLAIAPRPPDQVRLSMTDGQRRAVIALCTAGIPVAWLVLGAGLLWWRRRRAS
jgi:ABC-2 type transport system permease protein